MAARDRLPDGFIGEAKSFHYDLAGAATRGAVAFLKECLDEGLYRGCGAHSAPPGHGSATVLKLSGAKTRSLVTRLGVAAVLMIALGYPGEVADPDSAARWVWWIAGMIPFLYILYVLFVELADSLQRQSENVKRLVGAMRYVLVVTWSVYPIAYHSYVPSYLGILVPLKHPIKGSLPIL